MPTVDLLNGSVNLHGHMTFASHRCWTVYVKTGVFFAAEAWRRQYGDSVRHNAIKAGGGTIIEHHRKGTGEGKRRKGHRCPALML